LVRGNDFFNQTTEEPVVKITTLRLSLILFAIGLIQIVFFQNTINQAMAADENIKKMAEIMLNLNHYPSDSEKQALKQITLSSSSSNYEKTVATAIINLQHQATAEDKEKLNDIINNKSAPEDVRTLATIVHDVNHHPSEEDKAKLKKMM
jgi:NADH:ubiquinone oxidoreductase subunit K